MPQVVAGQGADLSKSVAELVRDLLSTNWPATGYDVVKDDINFGLGTWDDYGDIDIHVNAIAGTSEPYVLGWSYSKIIDPVAVRLFYRKNSEEIPPELSKVQRKVEEIIKDNTASLGQGITMLRWDGWGDIIEDESLQDVWVANGTATAIYWRVKV
jgi:hypothetical protein